jgi:hypothetical protein
VLTLAALGGGILLLVRHARRVAAREAAR